MSHRKGAGNEKRKDYNKKRKADPDQIGADPHQKDRPNGRKEPDEEAAQKMEPRHMARVYTGGRRK